MRIPRPVRILLGVAAALAAIAGGIGYWALQLEPVIREAVNVFLHNQVMVLIRDAESERLQITIGEFDFSLARGHLVIDTIAVVYEDSTDRAVERLRAASPNVVLTGISIPDIVLRRRLLLKGVEIERPTVYRQEAILRPDSAVKAPRAHRDSLPAAMRRVPNPESYSLHGFARELYGMVIEWLPQDVAKSKVELVRVDRATITSVEGLPGEGQQTIITDLFVELKGIGVDSARERLVRDVWISCPRFQVLWEESPRALDFHGVALRIGAADSAVTIDSAFVDLDAVSRLAAWQVERSYAKGSFTTRRVTLEPRISDAEFFKRARTRATRVRLAASDIEMAGMMSGSTLMGQTVARRLEIGNLELDAAVDKRYPLSTRRRRSVMPPQGFAALPWGFNLDTVLVRDGEVRYAEIQKTGEVSRIRFTRLAARMNRVANWDPTGPIEIAASGHMYDAGIIQASFTIPVHPDRFSMEVHGTWAGMPLERLNEFIIYSDGARVTKGTAGKASFRFRVANGVARGTLSPTWEDLGVELVDKETGKANLGKRILSFVAKTFVVRSNNHPGEKGYKEDYPILYQVKPNDSFFGVLWQSVRSAILPAMKK